MATETASITQDWDPVFVKETVAKSVKLIGAPDITWRRKAKYGPGRGRPYRIKFTFTRCDGGPWFADVTIYAQRRESPVGDWFDRDKLISPPQWLTDLIDSATPQN